MTDMWAYKLRMSYLTGFSSLLDPIPFPKLYPPPSLSLSLSLSIYI